MSRRSPYRDAPDDRVIRDAAAGQKRAFRELYERYARLAFSRIRRLVGPGPDADDLVQETFVRVHRNLHRFRLGEPFGPWVGRIARNVAISHLRKRRRPVDLVALRQLETPRDEWRKLNARDKVRIVYAALDEVDSEAREAFVLHTIEGHTLQQIADETDTSINTIASRVRRTRARLLDILERADRADIRARGGNRS